MARVDARRGLTSIGTWYVAPPTRRLLTSSWGFTLSMATLRRAEFGFLGVWVYTRVHTPRRCGAPFRAGVLVLSTLESRPFRTSWAMVGTKDDLSGSPTPASAGPSMRRPSAVFARCPET